MEAGFVVQGGCGSDDGLFEGVFGGEGLMSEMMGFEVAPDDLDVVEFGGVFGR